MQSVLVDLWYIEKLSLLLTLSLEIRMSRKVKTPVSW